MWDKDSSNNSSGLALRGFLPGSCSQLLTTVGRLQRINFFIFTTTSSESEYFCGEKIPLLSSFTVSLWLVWTETICQANAE